MTQKKSAEKDARDIRRKTRREFSAEEEIRIVREGLRGDESIASLCRREDIAANLYYNHERPHEAIDNETPDDMYRGRQCEIVTRREEIERLTLQRR